MTKLFSVLIMTTLISISIAAAKPCDDQAASAQEASPSLATRWTDQVTPEAVHGEYPRPQLKRPDWKCLNGLWECVILPKADDRPTEFPDRILVPFPVESALSGMKKRVGAEQRLWYRRTFMIKDAWRGHRIMLHFGAVDWDTTVWVNGLDAGRHRGGYDPFSLDITGFISDKIDQEIVVCVWDPTDEGYQPRGKQVGNPHGIWYTPTTGMWQTVWLEPVPTKAIGSLKMTPDIDANVLRLLVRGRDAEKGSKVKAVVVESARIVAEVTGSVNKAMDIRLESPRLWSPDSPFLYDLQVMLFHEGRVIDEVSSYFGMRKIETKKDVNGMRRLFLNNEPLFQYGLLDQGFWPDGLYTAPTDEALRYDIEVTRDMGFNMARKHVKVEPDRWYYWCDKLGLLVWQDMPSGDKYIGGSDPDIKRSPASARQFSQELRNMIDAFYNHPCIVMWVPFNEGWGQSDTGRVTNWIKMYDPSRLVNSASGWTDRGTGDVHDIHSYPGPASPAPEKNRAAVLGEFGGLGLPVSGHTWQDEKNWGYRSYETKEALMDAYESLLLRMKPLIGMGLSAAVYTQTTDVEIEVNGIMTYDRACLKLDPERARKAAMALYEPIPRIRTLVPAAGTGPVQTADARPEESITWRYTVDAAPAGWEKPGFDDSAWQQGCAGFGKAGTPGAEIGTPWTTPQIWIRREFVLDKGDLSDPHLWIHHDEDADIYINGILAARLEGYTTSYTLVPLLEESKTALKPGSNTLAIACRQTQGGQYIDAGLVDLLPGF